MTEQIEKIVADIVATAPTASPPAELLARVSAIEDGPDADKVRDLGLILWGTAASFVTWAASKGYDREATMRIVAMKLEAGAAMFVRRLYADLGKPFSPARFAIAAYVLAEHADQMMTPGDIAEAEQMAADFKAEEGERA